MNKLITPGAKLFLVCIALQLVCASPSEAQSNNSLKLGSEDHIVYIDIHKLATKIKFENKSVFDLFDSKRSVESFYHKWGWESEKCLGGTLREGVIFYCLPYVVLGQHISDAYHQQFDKFVDIGPFGTFVWYELNSNQFYLWNASWNFTNALGTFDGNPTVVLRQAIKLRQGERHPPGVSLSVVSQRWAYPDERDARMPRNSEYYDCSHDSPCGREIEQQKLNTFVTRFRLTNNGRRNIYYLANYSNDNPIGYTLVKFSKRTDAQRTTSRAHAEGSANVKWKALPSNSSVEFEVKETGGKLKNKCLACL